VSFGPVVRDSGGEEGLGKERNEGGVSGGKKRRERREGEEGKGKGKERRTELWLKERETMGVMGVEGEIGGKASRAVRGEDKEIDRGQRDEMR